MPQFVQAQLGLFEARMIDLEAARNQAERSGRKKALLRELRGLQQSVCDKAWTEVPNELQPRLSALEKALVDHDVPSQGFLADCRALLEFLRG